MLGKSLRNLGSNPLVIQAAPIASGKSSPDTSEHDQHDAQKAEPSAFHRMQNEGT